MLWGQIIFFMVLVNPVARLRLMNPETGQEVVLQGEQIEQDPVAAPAQGTDESPCHCVEDEVVGCCDDSDEDEEWVAEANKTAGQTTPREVSLVLLWEWDCHDGDSNQEGISKVQRGHSSWYSQYLDRTKKT